MELQTLLYNNYGPIARLDSNYGFDPIIFIFDPEAAMQVCIETKIYNEWRKYIHLSNKSYFSCLGKKIRSQIGRALNPFYIIERITITRVKTILVV